jgi:hypothetical protein
MFSSGHFQLVYKPPGSTGTSNSLQVSTLLDECVKGEVYTLRFEGCRNW